MKNLSINRLTGVLLVVSLGFLSISATAGQDEHQRYLTQQAIKAKQESQAVEASEQQVNAVKLEECKKLIEKAKRVSGS